ncbi:MAG: UDP-glucose 4-epimerase GalE [Oscillospiraceae bacterium]|nr:UDP-glucose 4-epimerase GalE [Oscillospiraceae bacterium]
MAILLTGGAGYIGSHTAVAFLDAGVDVVLADNFDNASPKVLDRIEAITGKKPKCVRADMCDKQAVEKIFAENEITGVVHFAGYKAVGESCRKPLKYYRNNLDSALTVLEVMKKHGCTRFVFSSSATVYGDQPAPLTESTHTGDCSNPYGWTKYMIEQILKTACDADPDLSVVLLRYFNPIGAHPSGMIGDNPNGIPNNLMPYVTQVAVGKLPRLNIFGDDYDTPDGTGVRDYIHVCDLADGHLAAIRYAENHVGCEVFNLGTGVGYSVLDIVKTFSRVNNLDLPYAIAPRRPGDLATVYADPKKAETVLGWTAKRTLDDMCRDSWNWPKQNPNGYEE